MRLDFLVPIFGILLMMIPVLGITTIVTLRWGLMPFMERLARELEGSGFVASKVVEDRVAQLTRELETVTAEVERLQKAQEFDRRLLESRSARRSPGRPSPEQGTPGQGTDDAARPDPPVGGERAGHPGRRGSEGPRTLSSR
jgi:hypothetical protein